MEVTTVIVLCGDGTVKAVPSDKILASEMTILEDVLDMSRLDEKVAYWNRVCNYKPEPDKLLYGFVNRKTGAKLYSVHPEIKLINGIRHKEDWDKLEVESQAPVKT